MSRKGSLPLVLVHGAGGSRLHWPGSLRRLPGATVYTLDLPGHGRSAGAGCDTIEGYATAVADFLRAVGVERAVIAGHSMGGAIAMCLALDFAGLVSGLVLVATGARLRVAPAILEGIRDDFAQSVALITRYAWSAQAPARLVARGRKGLLETDPAVLLSDFTACDRFDVMDRLGEIRVPTLVVVGTEDQLTPPRYALFLAGHIPGALLAVIEGAGHMVMLEQPDEVEKAAVSYTHL
ncbi:MAG: alpha/beta hydrolase, partial [Chloroflexaceae bacterium]|nr:alpha/beta hydrolase [Chloroflexaceae bacterium]